MTSPFTENWSSNNFVTADNLNKTTVGSGTTAEREAITTWALDRMFVDTTERNIYMNVGTLNNVNWSSLIVNSVFGNSNDGEIVAGDYTANSYTISPFEDSEPKSVRNYSNITIPAGDTLNLGNLSTSLYDVSSANSPKKWILFVADTLTINGTLNLKGRGGRGGSVVGTGGTGGAETTNSNVNIGGEGTSGESGGAGFLKPNGSDGSSVEGISGGTGGTGAGNTIHSSNTPSTNNGATGGTAGPTGDNIPKRPDGDIQLEDFTVFQTVFNDNLAQWGAGGSSGGGGSGGGSAHAGVATSGSGGNARGTGGAGGDGGNGGLGGAGGGSVVIIAFNVIFGSSGKIEADGIGGGVGLAGDDSPDLSVSYEESGHTFLPTGDSISGASGGTSNGANGSNGNVGSEIVIDSQPQNRGQVSGTGGGGAAGGNGANGDGGFILVITSNTISTSDRLKVTVNAGSGGVSGTAGNKVFLKI